ncbi:hypothetical protein BH11ARM1_BH11ARM1_16640 [soil metagenome]
MRQTNAILILVLGVLSIVSLGFVTGVPAWIMGNNALRDIDSGLADPKDRQLVVAGRVTGMVGTAISCIVPCAFVCLSLIGVVAIPFMGSH